MKKIIVLIVCALGMQLPAIAQFDSEEFRKSMEEMQKQLQQLFGEMDDTKIKIDTFYFKGFGEMEDLGNDMFELLPEMMENIDMEGMLKLMEENMKQLEGIDLGEMEELFREFNFEDLEQFRIEPLVPAPEQDGPAKKEEPKKKPKYKSYKI